MNRIVAIPNVGNVAFPDHMTDAEVAQAAAKLHAQANRPASQPAKKAQWEPGLDDPVLHIQTSDGKRWHLHADDLDKAKQRDPGLKVLGNPQ